MCNARLHQSPVARAVRFVASGLLLLAPLTAHAAGAELFKCVDGAGVISIQSEACPAGATQVWRRDATPEPAPTPEQAAQADAKRLRDQQTVRELSEIVERKLQPVVPAPTRAAATTEAAAADPCEAAQDFAASVRDKPWLAMSEDQVRRIYGWVAEQCKVPDKDD